MNLQGTREREGEERVEEGALTRQSTFDPSSEYSINELKWSEKSQRKLETVAKRVINKSGWID